MFTHLLVHVVLVVSHWDFELFSSSNHISPLLNRPQGCQGCQKNRKDLRITTRIRFATNFQPNLKKIWKITKKPAYFHDFCWFWRILCHSFNFSWKLTAKWIVGVIFRPFWFFWHPWHPWGRLSSGDIRVLRFVLFILWCWRPLTDFFHFYENVVQCQLYKYGLSRNSSP